MAEWAGLGYYARARNLLKCARAVVADHGGVFPDTHAALLGLPGIGPYTAAAISAIAFDRVETVVDGNVERVMARMFDIHTPLPAAKAALTDKAAALTPANRPGDYAQAVMDLGATICTPRNPACGICPWREPCAARAAGTAPDLPKKTPKKAKPVRHGAVYVARTHNGATLLERREDKGLLGGTLGFPGSVWVEIDQDLPKHAPPIQGVWVRVPTEARHTFTHFHLRLTIFCAVTKAGAIPQGDAADMIRPGAAAFIPKAGFRPSDLPTVMRKVFDLAHGAFDNA